MVRRLLLALLAVASLAIVITAARPHLVSPPASRAAPVTAAPVAVAPVDSTNGHDELANLDPALRRSFEAARAAAAAEGIELKVNSAWRSAEHQQQLFTDAIKQYGSASEARKWVLPPNESAHVQGRAIDVGPPSSAAWLERNGERFGLCRRYANEPWHFERLAGARGSTCPAMEPHA
jgi:hypothetical protein